MKLREPADRVAFLADIGRLDLVESNESLDIPEELFELFVKRRRPLVRKLVSFRRSQTAKASWRHHRWKHLTGVKRWHKSVNGKRFHRALGRYLASRITRPHLRDRKKTFEDLNTLQDTALKAISSIRTHMYIDMGYYLSLDEEASLFQLMDYAIPVLNSVELKLFEDAESELTADEFELLLRLTDDKELCKSISSIVDLDADKVLESFTAICGNLIKSGKSKDSTYFLTDAAESLTTHLFSHLEKIGEEVK